MPAPKGNKYTIGNKGNWHRTVWDDPRLAKEGKQLLEWADDEESLTMLQYCAKYNIAQQLLLWACQEYPVLAESYKLAKAKVGARREVLGLRGVLNAGLVQRAMTNYDVEQKGVDKEAKADEKHAEAQAQIDAQEEVKRRMKEADKANKGEK